MRTVRFERSGGSDTLDVGGPAAPAPTPAEAQAGARAGHPAMPPERTVRENFPVALRAVPARYRDQLNAVYRYVRLVDDIGDEAAADQRLGLLDLVDRDLDLLYGGGTPTVPAVRGMARLVHEHGIPEGPMRKLVQAQRQDQEVLRYDTWEQLVEYCSLSADPVGHLVLHVFDAVTPERMSRSDRVCTALQVLEHCQDVAEDFAQGRVYLPAEDLRAFGCTDGDLEATVTPTRLRGVLARVSDRAGRLLDDGTPLVGSLDGWARISVAGYVAGGRATLAALRSAGYDVLGTAVRPRRTRTVREALLVMGRR